MNLILMCANYTIIKKAYAIDITAHEKSDFDEAEILTQLRRAGGANYDRGSHNY